jgi:integrase
MLSLAEARRTVRKLSAQVSLGHDVAGEKQAAKREAAAKIREARNARTVGKLADEYFERHILGRWKHPDVIRSRIEKNIAPALGKMRAADVKPRDIDALLQTIVARHAPAIANSTLRLLKNIFDYGIKRQVIETNPAAAFNQSDAGGKEEARKRWLTREEIIKLFRIMRGQAGVFAIENHYAVRLLLMLAVRKEELIAAQWREFDLDRALWRLPEERTKTGAAIDIPLPAQAVETLRGLRRLACGSSYVFPARKMQISSLPHICPNTLNAALAKRILPALAAEGVPPFVIHDLRRTARSHLSALGVAPHIAESCLNHKLKGVAGVYDRHGYFDERKKALAEWARLLAALEEGREDYNVVPLMKSKEGLG